MDEAPNYAELADAVGISRSYAHEIVNGPKRPARSLAIHIFRRTGWRHPMIAALTDEQIATLEAVEPWVRPADQRSHAA